MYAYLFVVLELCADCLEWRVAPLRYRYAQAYIHIHTWLCISSSISIFNLPIYLFIYLSIYRSIYRSIDLYSYIYIWCTFSSFCRCGPIVSSGASHHCGIDIRTHISIYVYLFIYIAIQYAYLCVVLELCADCLDWRVAPLRRRVGAARHGVDD